MNGTDRRKASSLHSRPTKRAITHTKATRHGSSALDTVLWVILPLTGVPSLVSRWQLLDKPLSLAEFNALPKVTEFFFEYNLNIRSKIQNPLEFRISTEIKIGGHEAMRFKYKLYPAEEIENSSLNHYVFCQLKEDRLVGSFMVSPPLEGRFYLKVSLSKAYKCPLTKLNIPCRFLLSRKEKCTEASKICQLL